MCQLTLVNIKQIQLTKLCLAIQMTTNTRYTHQDGAGIAFKDGKIFSYIRSETAPFEDKDFSDTFINPILAATPILAHVRLATNKKETVSEEKSHPFYHEEAGLLLAHNGTLSLKDETREKNIEKEFPGMIDSEIFLEVLGKHFIKKKRKNLAKSLKETMKLFNGKFAFLIVNLNDQEIYVVRGKLATLFKSEIKINEKFYGYVINTERKDLKDASVFISHIWRLYNKSKIEFSEPELVSAETINRVLPEGLEKIDTITENKEITYYPKVRSFTEASGSDSWRNRHSAQTAKINGTNTRKGILPTSKTDTPIEKHKLAAKKIEDFRVKYFLTISELDHLLWYSLGCTLHSITPTDVRNMYSVLDPLFEAYIEETGGRKKKKLGLNSRFNLWTKIHRNLGTISSRALSTYKQFSLQFPYFLNSYSELHSVEVATRIERRKLEKKRKEKFL